MTEPPFSLGVPLRFATGRHLTHCTHVETHGVETHGRVVWRSHPKNHITLGDKLRKVSTGV
jgi:hypothetical protein